MWHWAVADDASESARIPSECCWPLAPPRSTNVCAVARDTVTHVSERDRIGMVESDETAVSEHLAATIIRLP